MAQVAIRESPIGGLGLFTREGLAEGEVVREFVLGREVTRNEPLRPELGELPEHCPLIDGRFYLVGPPERHLNHSCDPNCYLRFEADRIEVVPRRSIAAGDELTIDYLINNSGGESWPCQCGAARCRGETSHSFFTLPEGIQREYLPLLAPWFRKSHALELAHLTESHAGPTASGRLLTLACLGAAVASGGDLLMLWVANSLRPELGLPRPGTAVLWVGCLLGVAGIPLYAAGYRAVSRIASADSRAVARLIALAGAGAAGLGTLIHGLTAALIHAEVGSGAAGRPPLEAVGSWGAGIVALWAAAALLVLAASAAVLAWGLREPALPRWWGWLNPAFATLALAGIGATTELGRAFLVPAAPNLAHLLFFAASLAAVGAPAVGRPDGAW